MAEAPDQDGRRAELPWIAGLKDLLRRLKVPIDRIRVAEGSLVFEMTGSGGRMLTLVMRHPSSEGAFYRVTDRYAYHYHSTGETSPEDRRVVDLLIGILAHIEDRLPDYWVDGAGGSDAGTERGADPVSFARRYPFANVEQSSVADRTEVEVMLRVTARCNQDCPFCSAPPCDTPATDELLDCMDAVAKEMPGARIVLTGGEPTFSRDFLALVRHALGLDGVTSVQVQTNAVAFKSGRRVNRLPHDDRLYFFVSLHAVDPVIYDKCTGSTGQLPAALDGIRNLLRSGHRVLLNTVVNSLNVGHLPDMINRLPALFEGLSLPGLHFSILMCPPGRPASGDFVVRYGTLVEVLGRASKMAREAGMYVEPLASSTHASVPPCFLGEDGRGHRKPRLSEGETGYEDMSRPWVKARSCTACIADPHCLGVPAPYAKRYGLKELSPILPGRDRRVVFREGDIFDPEAAVDRIRGEASRSDGTVTVVVPSGFLTSGFLEGVGGPGAGIRVEARLPEDGVLGAGAVDDLVRRLISARAGGLDFEYVFEVTGESLDGLPGLVPLAAELEPRIARRAAIVLDLLDPTQARRTGRSPVSITSATRDLDPRVLRFVGSVMRFRSAAGRPPCLFPGALEQALLGEGEGGDSRGRGSFGPGCGDCALNYACPGLSRSYAAEFGLGEMEPFRLTRESRADDGGAPAQAGEVPWVDKVRWMLRNRPEARLRLGDVLTGTDLPLIRCTRPFTRLELHDGGTYGPCCADYIEGRHFVPDGAGPGDLWDSGLFSRFRSEVRSRGKPATCRETCPILVGATETPADFHLKGGPPEVVESQIRTVEAMIYDEPPPSPQSLCVPVTSFCNHDCLMCDCGEKGTLDDQRPESFYRDLEPWIAGGLEIDANGGEPLASPVFREFLEGESRRDRPAVVSIVTNGSLLTPKWLSSLERIPFRSIVISINAATPSTYEKVNRGSGWRRIRENLDFLKGLRESGRYLGGIVYSMVILRCNLPEIGDFAEMAIRDGSHVRFMLPFGDRNGQSIMTDARAMEEARAALNEVAERLETLGWVQWARDARANVRILEDRLARGILDPL